MPAEFTTSGCALAVAAALLTLDVLIAMFRNRCRQTADEPTRRIRP